MGFTGRANSSKVPALVIMVPVGVMFECFCQNSVYYSVYNDNYFINDNFFFLNPDAWWAVQRIWEECDVMNGPFLSNSN